MKKRGQGGHKAAARRYSTKAHGGDSYARNTKTNTHPGLKDLSGLANGVFESKDTNYLEDENKILKAKN